MKRLDKISARIISTGRQSFKRSAEYRRQVESIRNEISSKYLDLESNEKNSFKKLILLIKKRYEIRKAINKLTSLDKMFLKTV